ncbi:DHS-like NAD/FAD-binding domain-containing protein [Emericellopsis atlantica]|uniref:DHS-like NAD/FAD-binding domain-containing protein n=1 Tax=Emericellopsis atlantica TaxID=2614577 RepID=A0A9P8CSG1_9HYPO|nr:DHS-like NAD/FAD-binding domain-containing protein [Emericellopsis atlantica]KAG9257788.1 DHS-like NAD/FAD-binding domain-containing protein [Emericellopsis atlantica]
MPPAEGPRAPQGPVGAPPLATPETATPEELERAAITISVADLEERVADTRDSWETDSMYEDILETLEQESGDTPGSCTPEEASRLRRELREYGPVVFAQRTLDSGRYTARKLLTAFNLKAPAFLDDCPDEDFHPLLTVAITRELAKRAKLTRYNTVNDAVHLLQRSSNVIVLTGAGISTSLGIPDFRSKGTGLYSKLEHLGLNDPQEVFDIHTFKDDPTIFYSVAKDIIPSTDRYTPTHKFIAMLHERGKLLTNYSQNIDNLEIVAGVPNDRLIQCHGSFGGATCVECGYKTAGEDIFPDIRAGVIPKCPRCIQRLRPAAPKRKRSSEGPNGRRRRRKNGHDDDDDDDDDDPAYDIPQAGVMKPDITFFGEDLPDEFSKRLTEHDREKVDLVVVIGTSLKVTPVSEIVGWLPSHIPQLYISRQAVTHINFDIDLLGDCDVVVEELCRRLGWELKHEMVTPGRITVKTEEGYKSRHVFTKETSE